MRNTYTQHNPADFLSTGIAGLDFVLSGGLQKDRLYLIEGEPGCGKTTTGMLFLLEGVKRGESALYITLAESHEELKAVADSHGWDISALAIHEVLPDDDMRDADSQYTMFHPSEVEMNRVLNRLFSAVDKYSPSRVVIDSLSELQLMSDSSLRYRRQVLTLKQYFARKQCTVLLLDDRSAANRDHQVRSIAHGVIELAQDVKDYGAERRRLRVVKYRGHAFVGGLHDYVLVRGGVQVYPRLVAATSRNIGQRTQLSSGLPELDKLLGGGLEEATSTLIVGPPGSGKSSLAAQFVLAAANQGHKAAIFLFEESTSNMLHRADGISMNMRDHIASGRLKVQQIDPAELTPGQFAAAVVDSVEHGAKVVVIDSLNGYLQGVPDERFMTTHLHEVLTYLGQHKVVTLLVGVQAGMLGGPMTSALDMSYVADNVLMLRYFEEAGELQLAISVFKKRGSGHERTIRRYAITSEGIVVGEVLRRYRGILTGVPVPISGEDSDRPAVAK